MYLVFDIGGTNTRFGFSSDGKNFIEAPVSVSTPQDWKKAEELLVSICAEHKDLQSVCVAIAGEFDATQSTLVFSPNLTDWVRKPLRSLLEKSTGAQVELVNDAVAAGIAEAREGAGKGYSIVAYLTISTGIGGARIVNGEVDENRRGFEPGQHIIDTVSGETLEQKASGSSFIQHFGPDFIKNAPKEAWDSAAHDLAVGIFNTLDFWSPDIVVLGGSMITKSSGISLARVQEHLNLLKDSREIPPITLSQLGDESGLRGALLLVSQK